MATLCAAAAGCLGEGVQTLTRIVLYILGILLLALLLGPLPEAVVSLRDMLRRQNRD